MTLPMSRGQFKSDYLLKKRGIGVSGNISAFQAEVDSSNLLFHSYTSQSSVMVTCEFHNLKAHNLEVESSSLSPATNLGNMEEIEKAKMTRTKKTNGSEVHQVMTALTDTTIRGIVRSANEEGIKRGDIVSLLKENGQFVLIYFK